MLIHNSCNYSTTAAPITWRRSRSVHSAFKMAPLLVLSADFPFLCIFQVSNLHFPQEERCIQLLNQTQPSDNYCVLLHIFTNIFVTVIICCLEGYVVNSKTTGNIEYYITGAASLSDNKTCFILPSRCLSYTSSRIYRGHQVMMFLNVKFSSGGQ